MGEPRASHRKSLARTETQLRGKTNQPLLFFATEHPSSDTESTNKWVSLAGHFGTVQVLLIAGLLATITLKKKKRHVLKPVNYSYGLCKNKWRPQCCFFIKLYKIRGFFSFRFY